VSKNALFLSVPLNANELWLSFKKRAELVLLPDFLLFMFPLESDNDGETQEVEQHVECNRTFLNS